MIEFVFPSRIKIVEAGEKYRNTKIDQYGLNMQTKKL